MASDKLDKLLGLELHARKFLKKHIIKSSDIKIKGIIPFSTSVHNFTFDKSKKKKTLLVFDVQPVKSYIYAALAPTVDFYSENNMIIFLKLD